MEKSTTEQLLSDDQKWDDRELGADKKYVKPASKEQMEKFDRALGVTTVNIRLPNELLQSLKDKADREGFNINYLIRQALNDSLTQ